MSTFVNPRPKRLSARKLSRRHLALGFTLIELIVAIGLIGSFVGIAVPGFQKAKQSYCNGGAGRPTLCR